MNTIRCRSWVKGVKVVSLIQLVTRSNRVQIKTASDLVESFLAGGDLVINTNVVDEAILRKELVEIGVRLED